MKNFGLTVQRSQWGKCHSTISVPSPIPEYKTEDRASNVICFPGTEETTEHEFLSTLSELGGITLTPMKPLGIILRVMLKNRITDDEIDKICSAFYNALKENYSDY